MVTDASSPHAACANANGGAFLAPAHTQTSVQGAGEWTQLVTNFDREEIEAEPKV